MSFLEKIQNFLNKFLKKESEKKLNLPQAEKEKRITNSFEESIKVDLSQISQNNYKKGKNKIETLVCDGDGLGIQGKLKG